MLTHRLVMELADAVGHLRESARGVLAARGVHLDEPFGIGTDGGYTFTLRSIGGEPAAMELVAESSTDDRSRTSVRALDLRERGWLLFEHEQGHESDQLDPCPDLLRELVTGMPMPEGIATLPAEVVVHTDDDLKALHRRVTAAAKVPVVLVVDEVGEGRPLVEAVRSQVGPLAHLALVDRSLVTTSRILPDQLSTLRAFGSALLSWGPDGFGVDHRHIIPSEVGRRHPQATARRLQRLCLEFGNDRPPASEVSLLRERLASVRPEQGKEYLELWEEEVKSLTEQVNDLSSKLARLREENADLTIELEIAEKEKDDLARSHRYLERRMFELHQTVFDDEDQDLDFEPTEVNSSVEALNLARSHLSLLSIPVQVDEGAAELDTDPRCGIYAQRCWEALRALDHYARAKRESKVSGDFRSYCSDTPAGFAAVSAQAVSMHESESTMGDPQLRGVREFTVSRDLDPAGRRIMQAHIRLKPVGSVAPRLYFLDDTGGRTGKVHVGYVGHHLRTAG